MNNLQSIFGVDYKLIHRSLPLSVEAMTEYTDANRQGLNPVINIDLAATQLNRSLIPDYLAHMGIQFVLPSEDQALWEDILARELWFKKNNVTFEFLKLSEIDVIRFFKNISSYSLAKCSALEFDSFILEKLTDTSLSYDVSYRIDEHKKAIIEKKISSPLKLILKGIQML